MLSLIELLRKAQKELTCPTCGRTFSLSEIRPREHNNNTIMLQAICSNNHFPIVLIFIPSKPLTTKITTVNKQDTELVKQWLGIFDGNFSELWK